ncbi:hypothetical protein BaRGS_00015583 [Batillaria attramentaria]|uniref:Ferric-chelate reductase 1 n=1 Tax=Batillaria attramentaria TaxID=370345 RepID=A0ABD0L1N5_9CAEN
MPGKNACLICGVIVVVLLVPGIRSYPSGAGDEACPTQSPQVCHGGNPQTSESPYAISVEATTYSPGENVSVTLASKDGTPYMGFLLGAHRVTGNMTQYLGVFSATPDAQRLTHTNSDLKKNLTFTWTAPLIDEGDIHFTSAFVFNKTTYWVDVNSSVVTPTGFPSNQTTQTTVVPTTGAAATKFPRDASCGQNKSCYGHCQNDACDFLATWYEDDQSLVISLKSVFSSGSDVWMAIGFGPDEDMNGASVSECVANGGDVQAFMSYNDEYGNKRVTPDPKVGLSNATGSLEDGIFTCTFHRLLVVAAGSDVFNLTTPYHVLMARGQADGWEKKKHSSDAADAFVTSDSYNLTKVTDIDGQITTVAPTTEPPTSKFKKDSACGDTKSCYGDCKEDGCDFLSTWYKSDQSLTISLKSTFSGSDELWMAIGFGTAAKMAPASVSECVISNGQVQAFMSYNKGHSNSRVEPDNAIDRLRGPHVMDERSAKVGLSNVTGSLENGWNIRPHAATDDYVTADSYDLTVVTDINAKLPSYPLVKLHGCLMTLAWVLSGSIGVLVARFYKVTWPNQTVCGVKIWFAVHRCAMLVAFVATVSGFVIIVADVKGYSEILGADYKKAHPILGIIVTALTVINPIMSLMRCSPTHEHRPIFNWAHWAVGTSAYILGVIAVGIGTRLFRAQSPEWVTYVVAGFGVWHVLAHAVLEFNKYAERSDSMVGVYKDLQSFSTSYDGRKVTDAGGC